MEETTKCMRSDLLLCHKLQRKQWWRMRLANLQNSIYSFSRETWVVLNFEEVKDSHSFEYYSIWRMIWLLFNSVCDTHSTVFCGQQNLQPCNQSVGIPHWKNCWDCAILEKRMTQTDMSDSLLTQFSVDSSDRRVKHIHWANKKGQGKGPKEDLKDATTKL